MNEALAYSVELFRSDLASALHLFSNRNHVNIQRWRGRALQEQDEIVLARAIGVGVVNLEVTDGYLTFRPGSGKGEKRYRLFIAYNGAGPDGEPALGWSWLEMFTQIAFAAELILDYGWPPESVELEVGALDVAAGLPGVVKTRPLLMAEVKTSSAGPKGLQAMMAVLNECGGLGPKAHVARDVRENAEAKYRCLKILRPQTFVAVAPDDRWCFNIEYGNSGMQFHRQQWLPPASFFGVHPGD